MVNKSQSWTSCSRVEHEFTWHAQIANLWQRRKWYNGYPVAACIEPGHKPWPMSHSLPEDDTVHWWWGCRRRYTQTEPPWKKQNSKVIGQSGRDYNIFLNLTGVYFISSYFFNLLAALHSMWDLNTLTRIKPIPPALAAWSLNHWTNREIPGRDYKINILKI